MTAVTAKSVLLGFHVCELCGGKTHVKRKDEAGKRAYNHCVDEHDLGCSHSTHATNAAQEKLLLSKMRPVKPLAGPTPSPTPEDPPATALDPLPLPTPTGPTATPPQDHTPEPTPTPAKPKRRGLFG